MLLLAAGAAAVPVAQEASAHPDPVTPVILGLAVILIAAKIGGDIASRVGQPAVLGELLVGVLIGNLGLVGFTELEFIKSNDAIDILARVGVLILLFEVGLESTVGEMVRVGLPALLVALIGVVTPFALGWLASAIFLPDHSPYVHAFIGATLTATSVGITARVFKDLGFSKSREARIILGAAVIDDVLGLVILAVVTGVIVAAGAGAPFSVMQTAGILGKALLFLFGALVVGVALSPRGVRFAARLRGSGVLLATALAFCFTLAYLAVHFGLAPLVGAYAAGLVLDKTHLREFASEADPSLDRLISPISSFLVPVFFVVMGTRVGLEVFADPSVLGLAAVLTVAAILGKQACSLGAIGRGLDRLTIGVGMVPRGEVGLIFANVGLGLTVAGERVVTPAIFSAVVIMVIMTTLVTPPALKGSLARLARRAQDRPISSK